MHDLTVLVLHEVGTVTVQNTGNSSAQWRRMLTGFHPFAARFHTVHRNLVITEERVEKPNGIRATANACD